MTCKLFVTVSTVLGMAAGLPLLGCNSGPSASSSIGTNSATGKTVRVRSQEVDRGSPCFVNDRPATRTEPGPVYADIATAAPATGTTTTRQAATSEPATPDRSNLPPAPLDSPPFPNSDWTGPDVLVGTRDGTSESRIEGVLKSTPAGSILADSRIRLYGWAEIGGNASTSNHTNSPVAYDLVPDQVVLDQFVFRVERVPDTAQTAHPDWGFRVTQLYGTDYRFTTAKGYASDQLLNHNRLYGYDIPEAYAELYLQNVAQGMVIKVGRFLSPPDIESSLANSNYMYSHSLEFSSDPTTFTGINTITKLNSNLSVEFGAVAGSDVSPFVNSASLNGRAMLSYRTDSGNDALYGGLNSIGEGKFRDGHDDLQQAVGVWGHKFTDRLHTQTEAYYMWQFDALTGGTVINGPSHAFAGSGPGSLIKGRADEWGAVNYLEYKLADNDYLTLRTDFFNDHKGQRTGYATVYNSETIGWSHNFAPGIIFRPEFRWDHSWQQAAYNDGLRKNQLTAAADFIFSF
jgi:hypothetical protein